MSKKKLSLKSFTNTQLCYLHKALTQFIEAGSGYGFINADMGHPVYVAGAKGIVGPTNWGDSPKKNELYLLLKGIHEEMKSRKLDREIKYRFDSWQNFCKFAVQVYRREYRKHIEVT